MNKDTVFRAPTWVDSIDRIGREGEGDYALGVGATTEGLKLLSPLQDRRIAIDPEHFSTRVSATNLYRY